MIQYVLELASCKLGSNSFIIDRKEIKSAVSVCTGPVFGYCVQTNVLLELQCVMFLYTCIMSRPGILLEVYLFIFSRVNVRTVFWDEIYAPWTKKKELYCTHSILFSLYVANRIIFHWGINRIRKTVMSVENPKNDSCLLPAQRFLYQIFSIKLELVPFV